jgi:hypothetical protein
MGECRARSPRSSKILIHCACPLFANGACACGRGGSDRSALLRACGILRTACRGHRAGRCGSRAVAVLSEGTLARDVLQSTQGAPLPMGTVRGYRHGRGTSLLWVRRKTAEPPSPLRVCSDLRSNELTGTVPSSLSALTNLEFLCVPPSWQRRLPVRPRRVGSVAACRGMHVGGIERGGAAAGLSRYSQRGTLARDVTTEYARGTPPNGYGARVPSR